MIFSRGKILYQTLSNSLMFIFVHWLKVAIFLEVHKVLFFLKEVFQFHRFESCFQRTTNIYSMILGNTVMHFQSLRILCPLICVFESFLYSSTFFAKEQTISCLSLEVLCWTKEIIFPVLDWREPSGAVAISSLKYSLQERQIIRFQTRSSPGRHL